MPKLVLRSRRTAVGVVAIAAIIGSVAWIITHREPTPDSDSPEDMIKFIASEKFTRLSPERRSYYLEQVRSRRRETPAEHRKQMRNLPPEERRKALENLFRAEQVARDHEMVEFMKMDDAAKTAFLDQRIAEMEDFHRRREAERASREAEKKSGAKAGKPAEPRPRPSEEERAARMKNMLETTPPEVRAARREFFRALRTRMQQLGKSFPRPGRR